jgi:hypothetical protein
MWNSKLNLSINLNFRLGGNIVVKDIDDGSGHLLKWSCECLYTHTNVQKSTFHIQACCLETCNLCSYLKT